MPRGTAGGGVVKGRRMDAEVIPGVGEAVVTREETEALRWRQDRCIFFLFLFRLEVNDRFYYDHPILLLSFASKPHV
jgi:hypothetical protein